MSKQKKSSSPSSSSRKMKVEFANDVAILSPHAVKIETWSKKDKESLGWKSTNLHPDILSKPQIHLKRNANRVLVVSATADGKSISLLKNISGNHFFIQVGSGEPFQLASKVLPRVKWPRAKPGPQKVRPNRYYVRVPIEVKTEAVSLASQAGISESRAAFDLAIESLSIRLDLPVVRWGRAAVPEDELARVLREWGAMLNFLSELEKTPFNCSDELLLRGYLEAVDARILEYARLTGLFLAPLDRRQALAAHRWVKSAEIANPGCLLMIGAALGQRAEVWSQIRRSASPGNERPDNILTLNLSGLLRNGVEKYVDSKAPSKKVSEKQKRAQKSKFIKVLLGRLPTARLMEPPSYEQFPFAHPANKNVYGELDQMLAKLAVALRKVASAFSRNPCSEPRLLRIQRKATSGIDDCVALVEFRRKQIQSTPALVELGLADLSGLRDLALRARSQAAKGNWDAADAADLLDYLTGFESAKELAANRREAQ